MKTVKVTAPSHFAQFLIAMTIPFFHNGEAYFIFSTHDPKKFRSFCELHGVRDRDIAQMKFEEAKLDIDYEPEEI